MVFIIYSFITKLIVWVIICIIKNFLIIMAAHIRYLRFEILGSPLLNDNEYINNRLIIFFGLFQITVFGYFTYLTKLIFEIFTDNYIKNNSIDNIYIFI
ncbi:hypothetical protein pb186bvf_003182 [Paramecium bursaria]